MRDDKDHNERLDDFSGYMRQRLEEHRLPVDAGCWDEVEARMNRRARSRGWLWTGGLAAAAVLALVIWLLPSPENISFDRSDKPNVHKVVVRDANGNRLTEEQISNLLAGSDRSLYRKWIPNNNNRATGLFVYDVAIDLRRLFCVSTNQLEPEITSDMVEKLKEDGWKVITTSFGECLLMPKEQREQIIPAIADALIDWHITSNQARTFSLMETLAIAISDNANTLAAAIRAKLVEDG